MIVEFDWDLWWLLEDASRWSGCPSGFHPEESLAKSLDVPRKRLNASPSGLDSVPKGPKSIIMYMMPSRHQGYWCTWCSWNQLAMFFKQISNRCYDGNLEKVADEEVLAIEVQVLPLFQWRKKPFEPCFLWHALVLPHFERSQHVLTYHLIHINV